jgi:hypothetical protein
MLEVPLLMWLRTVMNYQYRHGTPFVEAFHLLYAEGGIRRLYNGMLLTLASTSLARFGDMGANAGMLALLGPDVPLGMRTMAGSAASVAFRLLFTPLDTLKTMMQVEGYQAGVLLRRKVTAAGFGVLYHGALAAGLANFVGTYPWFWTFNSLDTWLPHAAQGAFVIDTLRSGLRGLCAACASDCCSNSFRVLKTARQVNAESISYGEAARQVVSKDGLIGLFGRGLRTRLAINGVQSTLFVVFWKLIQTSTNTPNPPTVSVAHPP